MLTLEQILKKPQHKLLSSMFQFQLNVHKYIQGLEEYE